jgi:Uma2 family endonuclease
MAAVIKLGPHDHGRPVTWDRCAKSRWTEGYVYEIVDGKLYVSERHELPENWVEGWAGNRLRDYAKEHPEVIDYVTGNACVFVPGRPGLTCLGPDQAAFRDFPRHRPIKELTWHDLTPILVVQALSLADPRKDRVRNVDLYMGVPTIGEYWLFNTRPAPEYPSLRVHRRCGSSWQVIDVAPRTVYSTPLLPGFKLKLDTRKWM